MRLRVDRNAGLVNLDHRWRDPDRRRWWRSCLHNCLRVDDRRRRQLHRGDRGLGTVRTAAAITPLSAHGPGTSVATAAIPSGSVSVPVLLLSGEMNIALGDTATAVTNRLGPRAESVPASLERAENGDRLTRTYDVSGNRFALVFQRLAGDPEPRVYAIYLLP